MVYALLLHDHLLLVLLCWLNGAIWNLDEEDRKFLSVVLDADGRLDLQAAVAVENLVELHATIKEGMPMEVLSRRVDVEEPGLIL